MLMAGFDKTLDLRIENFLAKFADADGANVSARIAVDSGEPTSIKLNMSARGGDDDANTSLSARLDVDGATMSGDAAGEAASMLLELSTDSQQKLAMADIIAEGDDPVTTAAVSPDFEIVDFLQQETAETLGADPAKSRTYLEAVWNEPFVPESLSPSVESSPTETGDADGLF